MQDKDFDRHIREKLAAQQVPYDPAAWEALSARLDAIQTPSGRAFGWKRWAVAATLLLSLLANALLGTYLLTRSQTDTVGGGTPAANAVAHAPADAGKERRRNPPPEAVSGPKGTYLAAASSPPTNLPSGHGSASTVPLAAGQAALVAHPAAAADRAARGPGTAARRGQLARFVPPGRIVPGPMTVASAFSDATAQVPASAHHGAGSAIAPPSLGQPLAWLPTPVSASLALSVRPQVPDQADAAAEVTQTDTPTPGVSRWSFAVAASADAHRTTYGDSPLAIGGTWGGDVRLHTSARGALLLGIGYSRKQYTQRFDNNAARFTTPTTSASLQGLLNVAATRQLEAVAGEMEVAGLSLAAEFVWAKRPQGGRWWARGGLSANYLLRQSYEYRYQALTAPPMMFIPNAQGAYSIATLTESSVAEVTRRGYAGVEMGLGHTGSLGRGLWWEVGPWCQVPIIDFNRSLERVPLSVGLRSALRFGSGYTTL